VTNQNQTPAGKSLDCDMMVIGAGMAGMAAALFAARRGLSTVLVGEGSEVIFSSGLFDLLGVHPVAEKKTWDDPWAALEALRHDNPEHPYARIASEDIRTALELVVSFLGEAGLPYTLGGDRNRRLLTSLGTEKITYALPRTMEAGPLVLARREPCLIMDIRGLKGFSARQIAAARKADWPDIRPVRIEFPGTEKHAEVYTEPLARSLEVAEQREIFAAVLDPHVKNVDFVGLPAILGIYRCREVLAYLEQRLGVKLFEIPTFPPCIPGLRLKEAFERHLPDRGVRMITGRRVLSARLEGKAGFFFEVGASDVQLQIHSRAAVLASGRFLGGGLRSDRERVRETIFGLPVHQPASRREWHRRRFLNPAGHPLNRAGLAVDDGFRPLGADGRPAHAGLFAAGAILAHQDWMRAKCGSGLAIASAYAAVKAFCETDAGRPE